MSRKRKPLEQLKTEPYLCKSEVARYLGIPSPKAEKVFAIASEIDRAELAYIVESDKVRRASALRAYGVTEEEINKKCGS